MLVNEAFARQLLPGEDPVGRRFRYGTTGKWRQIAGVVEDGKYRSLGETPSPTVFQDMEQDWRSNATLVARSPLLEAEIVRQLRHKAGMTIEELALASKVSRAMLSSVERGEKSPTLSVLTGIASGLNVPISRLMAEATPSSVASVVRRPQRLIFRDQETGIERHLLSPSHLDTGIELVEHVLPSGQRFAGSPRIGMRMDKYVVVIEDPTVWTRPWTVHEQFTKQSDPENRIYYEPRCVEGNYALPGWLRGRRMEELAFAQGRGPDPATKDDTAPLIETEALPDPLQ